MFLKIYLKCLELKKAYTSQFCLNYLILSRREAWIKQNENKL